MHMYTKVATYVCMHMQHTYVGDGTTNIRICTQVQKYFEAVIMIIVYLRIQLADNDEHMSRPL